MTSLKRSEGRSQGLFWMFPDYHNRKQRVILGKNLVGKLQKKFISLLDIFVINGVNAFLN